MSQKKLPDRFEVQICRKEADVTVAREKRRLLQWWRVCDIDGVIFYSEVLTTFTRTHKTALCFAEHLARSAEEVKFISGRRLKDGSAPDSPAVITMRYYGPKKTYNFQVCSGINDSTNRRHFWVRVMSSNRTIVLVSKLFERRQDADTLAFNFCTRMKAAGAKSEILVEYVA